MKTTKVRWTDKIWNPITGCTKVSAGCMNHHAEIMSRRLKAMGLKKYENALVLTLHGEALSEPLHWKTSHTIFVCPMSDLSHEEMSLELIGKAMKVISEAPYHNYQILTKRAARMYEYFSSRGIPADAWLGVTVDVVSSKQRIDYLRKLAAPTRFLSCEPSLEDLGNLDLINVDWVIVGGESGLKARPMKEEWATHIKQQADSRGFAFFFKQWGTWGSDRIKRNKKENGKLTKGQMYQAMSKKQ